MVEVEVDSAVVIDDFYCSSSTCGVFQNWVSFDDGHGCVQNDASCDSSGEISHVGQISWGDMQELCYSVGARLCTNVENEIQVYNSGCISQAHVWTQTEVKCSIT